MSAQPTLLVYCRPWCGDCQRALKWLDRQGYSYTKLDIDEDPIARQRCVELAGKVITPTFEVGEMRIIDFDPRALRDALGAPPDGR
jgi:glutaredoxin